MLAYIDYREPVLFNDQSGALIIVFLLMAALVSPLSPLDMRLKNRLTALYLPAIFLWWFFFKFMLFSLDPHIHYYLGPRGRFSWMMNSDICYAFGLVFSIRLARLSKGKLRAVGIIFAILYLLLILSGEGCRPAMMQT